MPHKIATLFLFELSIQSRINNIIKYLIIFFAFSVIATTLLNEPNDSAKFGIIFSLLYYPLSLMSFSNIIKSDLEDGYIELLLSSTSAFAVIMAKFLAILSCSIISFVVNLAIIILIFNLIEFTIIRSLAISLFLLLILINSLLLLINFMQCYFRTNANLISLIILPLLLPSMIVSGLLVQDQANDYLIYILLGINFIICPMAIVLSTYLLKNIYNI